MAAYGLTVEERTMTFIGNTRQEGYEAARRILDSVPETTALACFGDPMALGALAFARDYEHKTGKRLSVTGYDDVEEALFSEPRLTSVCQAKEEIGILAADILLKKIETPALKQEGGTQNHMIDPVLSVRESTLPISS